MSQLQVLSLLKQQFTDPSVTKRAVIQPLWSGYGELARYYSPRLDQSVVVKHIDPARQPKHPKGWNTLTGHERKLQSYQIEGEFYKQYAQQCDLHCFVPSLVTSFNRQQQQVLVLTDLDEVGLSQSKKVAEKHDIKNCIKWLAYFHARFLQQPLANLWPVGCYWHFATRQDEWHKMADGPLKQYAQQIDSYLNAARFQTCVHGDAKLANFCFSEDEAEQRVAAVDFQYVGRGAGIKDLAYFLGSCLSDLDLYDLAAELLDLYFVYLQQALHHYQVAVDFTALEQEWRSLYCFAWADFQRFLLGWSPEHYKLNPYMQGQTEQALAQLTG